MLRDIYILVIVAIAVISLAITLEYAIEKQECISKSVSFDESYYGIYEGCMVKVNDMWFPIDNVLISK